MLLCEDRHSGPVPQALVSSTKWVGRKLSPLVGAEQGGTEGGHIDRVRLGETPKLLFCALRFCSAPLNPSSLVC